MTEPTISAELDLLRRRVAELEDAQRERQLAEAALQEQKDYLAALHATALGLMKRRDLSALLEDILARAAQLLHTGHALVALVDESAETITVSVGIGAMAGHVGSHVKPGEGLTGSVWQGRKALVVGEYDVWDGRIRSAAPTGYSSLAGVPLWSGDEVIGVLAMAYDDPTRSFGERETEVLSRFAQLAALTIGNALLFESERQSRREAETLRAATQALSRDVALPRVLSSILTEIRKVVDYDSASVQELRGSRLVLIGGAGFVHPNQVVGFSFPLGTGEYPNLDRVVQSREPLVLEDAPAVYPGFAAAPHGDAAIRAWMGVPLLSGERVIGVITLDRRVPGAFTAHHGRLALAFASQAALSIEQARLYGSLQGELAERRRVEEQLRATHAGFAAGAREIRLAVDALAGATRLLLETPLSAEQRRLVDRVRESEEALRAILKDVPDDRPGPSGTT